MGTERRLLMRMFARLRRLSARRVMAVLIKEFIQLRRDRVTFGMMVGIPLLQLMLFGFARASASSTSRWSKSTRP